MRTCHVLLIWKQQNRCCKKHLINYLSGYKMESQKKLNNTLRVLDSDYGLPEKGTLLYAYQKNETTAVVKWEGLPTHPNKFERGKVVEKPIYCPYHNITPEEFIDMFHAELNKA